MSDNTGLLFVVCLVFVLMLFVSSVSGGWFDFFKRGITGKATEGNVGLNITISSNRPNITFVGMLPAQSITENGAASVIFNVTVNDSDGFGNIQTVTARFNRTGEGIRQNSSCVQLNTFATTNANYSCTVQLWYFDLSGDWGINITANDTSGLVTANLTTNFTLGQTSGFVLGPSNLTFPSIAPAAANQTATNDPLLLNNTGNKPITVGNIQVNATSLIGESDTSKGIYAGNFTIGTTTGSSGECDISGGVNNATRMSRGLFTGLNLSNMSQGNHSANDGVTGQEQLYLCILLAGSELSSQSYSTLNQGVWTVKII